MPQPTDAEIKEAADFVKQWIIFRGSSSGPILPAKVFSDQLTNRYAVKNTKKAQFLRFADQPLGINLDYTGQMVSRWIFTRCNSNQEPLKYGENIAIGTGGKPTWINFKERTFGVNLEFQNNPSCEWKILGGQVGTPVKTGDRVALFNLKSKASSTITGEFLIHFNRTVGHADVGWPTSQTLLDNIGDVFKGNWKEIATFLMGVI